MKYAVFYKKFDELDGDDFDKEVLNQYENLTLKKEGLSCTVNGQEVITTIDDLMQDMCEKQIEYIFNAFAERIAEIVPSKVIKKMHETLEQQPSKKYACSKSVEPETLPKHCIVPLNDVVPSAAPKRGKWVYDAEAYPLGNPYGHYDCDQCGESVPDKTNYCPNCGAYMRGDEE